MDLEDLRRSTAATVTKRDTASLFGIDERTLTEGIRAGTIPSIRVGRRVLIPREPLLALLTAHVTPGPREVA